MSLQSTRSDPRAWDAFMAFVRINDLPVGFTRSCDDGIHHHIRDLDIRVAWLIKMRMET